MNTFAAIPEFGPRFSPRTPFFDDVSTLKRESNASGRCGIIPDDACRAAALTPYLSIPCYCSWMIVEVRFSPMKVHEIMSPRAWCVGPANTLVEAAGVMRLFDVGAVPICDDDRVIGMLTDRDIVLHGVANGGDLNHLTVLEAGSNTVVSVSEDDEIESAARIMAELDMGRVPVVDREQHLVGMLSRADFMMPAEQ